MIPFGLTGGLNTAGLSIGGLNPVFTQTVALGELADVKIFTLGDGSVVMFAPEGRAFAPDVSVFSKQSGTALSAQTAETGLNPQADPPKVFEDKDSGSENRG